ncbi:hypothetical protein ACJ41O_001412 [Fusarium nematophilum]
MVYLPATKHINGARLLALDGGGVRGIMALEVLKELMERVKKRKGLAKAPPPADYFELAAGTSTGGIMGIMLFRLRMTAQQTIDEYNRIAQTVFSPKIYGWNISRVLPTGVASFVNNSKTLVQSSRFDDASMKKAIDEVVEKYGLDDNDKKLRGDAPLQHSGGARLLLHNRPEQSRDDNQDKVTISLAARATSAAPTFFPEVKFPEHKPELTFWDGGLLNNNPIDQLWYSRYELVQPEEPPPAISCVISLGTGYIRPDSPSDSWFQLMGVASEVMDFATNTNAKGKDFSRHMTHLNMRGEHKETKYVRLNPSLGKQEIGLADYNKMKELQELARTYLENPNNQKWIDVAVDAICC